MQRFHCQVCPPGCKSEQDGHTWGNMSFFSLPLLSDNQFGWLWAAGFAAWNAWFALTGWHFGWDWSGAYALLMPGLLAISVVSLLLLRFWAMIHNVPLALWAEWTRRAGAAEPPPMPRLLLHGLHSTLIFQGALGGSF